LRRSAYALAFPSANISRPTATTAITASRPNNARPYPAVLGILTPIPAPISAAPGRLCGPGRCGRSACQAAGSISRASAEKRAKLGLWLPFERSRPLFQALPVESRNVNQTNIWTFRSARATESACLAKAA